MTPDTEEKVEYPKATFRDLLQARANGVEIPPKQIELWRREEECIRSMASNPEAFRGCGLSERHFDAPVHRMAFLALMSLSESGFEGALTQAVLLSALGRFDEQAVMAGIRGSIWSKQLLDEEPIPAKLALQTVVEELKERRRIEAWELRSDQIKAETVTQTDFAAIQAVYARFGAQVATEAVTSRRQLRPVNARVWDPTTTELTTLLKTGIPQIDDASGGGHGRGEMMVVGGGTNHGKSYLGLQLAQLQAKQGRRAMYVSCEDPEELAFCRLLAHYTDPPTTPVSIRTRKVDPMLIRAAEERRDAELGDRLYLEEYKRPEIDKLVELLSVARWTQEIDLVVVDYLQAICDPAFQGNKVQEMSSIIAKLKRACTDLKISLVALSQYARDEYKNGAEPTLNSFKYCGDIENEAEMALCLWRDEAGALHVKIPKIKWTKADELRYIIQTNRVHGWMEDWEADFARPEDD